MISYAVFFHGRRKYRPGRHHRGGLRIRRRGIYFRRHSGGRWWGGFGRSCRGQIWSRPHQLCIVPLYRGCKAAAFRLIWSTIQRMGKATAFILFLHLGLFLHPGLSALAQPFPALRWTQLTEKEGLSCDKTTSVAQDGDGIIWVSTSNGLNRFDGYGFAKYFSKLDDTTSLLDNDIESIYADRRNNLWLTTAVGVCRFNTITHKTMRFPSDTTAPPTFRSFDNPRVWFDEKEDPFIVSPSGLYHFTDDAHYATLEEGFAPQLFQERLFTHYAALVRDNRGGLWSFQQNRLYKIDPVTKRVSRSITAPGHFTIYDVVFDNHNRAWISTWSHGVYRFDPADDSWLLIPSDHGENVVKRGVEWQLDGRRFIVFATNRPDLLFIDEETGKCRTYVPTGSGEYGIPFVDRQNILWIPTTKGLFCVNSY